MQFKTKLGLVDVPNDEVLAAADAIRSNHPDAVGQLQRRINELDGIRVRVVDDRDKLRAALQFIAEKAGDYHKTELGVIVCNAEWCKEQARAAIA